MSKRNRHPSTQAAPHAIEWLNHRTGYPTAEERAAIIQMRKELSFKIIELMVKKISKNDPRYREIVNRYGVEEVKLALDRLGKNMEISRVAEDAKDYRNYRLRYSKFGAGLQFYTLKEMDELQDVQIGWMKERLLTDGKLSLEGHKETENLLLTDWQNWQDITPPAIPPRPADFTCPVPGKYSPPVSELLEYGPDLEKNFDIADPAWKKTIPALTRMALDPGLLNDWPGDNASWAPWHAIHILGLLEAWESAPTLAELVDRENDWLSDHLPHIWADMGWEVEPTLWMILEDASASQKKRGLAAEALSMLAEEDQAITKKVTAGFGKILQNTKSFDPSVNAYIITFLDGMDDTALEELESIVEDAFADDRVDLDIITPEDIWEDDDDEFFEEDEE